MCNLHSFLSHAFGIGAGSDALMAQQKAAQDAAAQASDALTKAISGMNAASVPAIDNPSAQSANQSQMRKLLAAQGGAWSFGGAPTAAPATGTKVLLGS